MTAGRRKAGFENRLKDLESIVAKLEEGNLPLEESLALFEKGIALSRLLQGELQAAGLRVSKLLEQGGALKEVPLTVDEGDGDTGTPGP